ncbi:ABC transporter permease subunit [Haematospirillum jordaniae]|uniref:ABC transporter permease subunit n=1 Tax=Haematospirillum jordaniae TaxID=1549855 RepID=UPI0009EDC162|nr:ABC transporter permease subunit [Haematospirillum jordaniae]NKD45299.1 ABC transporter permease subunit [Haematospirillum jordaniae]NKD57291.1 ABC transporter permease subunit [Haematospirillum jordaniae]NKD59645.1 ABC transporter permease subunit [Haematospirillum jordaniae]NKD67217.1 ABC transporter permease subunit [Haematospirillum jordaniae]NKD79196.1 ABC transporter permease subunit [Haematospirillum jordaniae]
MSNSVIFEDEGVVPPHHSRNNSNDSTTIPPNRLGLGGRRLVIAVPYGWLLLFFLAPFVIVLKISFAEFMVGIPPYTPLIEWVDDQYLKLTVSLEAYKYLLSDPLYIGAYLSSLKIALISTLLTLLLGYPMAYGIARSPEGIRSILLLMVVLPFWTSFLIRVYAWIGILKPQGFLNNFLMGLGLINEPLPIYNTEIAVYIGLVYSYLPFMVLPLYTTLEKMDTSLLEAAEDLGCRPFKAFLSITLPLSMPGIIAGCMLVFIPAVGEFVIPDLLGGAETLMIGKVLWAEFFNNRDWPAASAVAVAMLLFLVGPIMLFQHYQNRQNGKEGEIT